MRRTKIQSVYIVGVLRIGTIASWRLPQPKPGPPSSSCLSLRCIVEYAIDVFVSTPILVTIVNVSWISRLSIHLKLTERISSSVMQPSTSVLFANTNKLAPESRYVMR